jgi:aromatic ring-opening dioxygenase catalytic subunit (LigB family)
MSKTTMPLFYIPHVAGPCFFMDWTWGGAHTWDALGRWLQQIAGELESKPTSVLLISAHWEADEFTVSGSNDPKLIFDYTGFPEHTYQLQYAAPGNPALARTVHEMLLSRGISARIDAERGLNHGAFVPLKLVFPDADIPVVQLSLKRTLSAAEHLAVGRALAPLRSQGVLIIGSGSSYHNLALVPGKARVESESFDDWLTTTLALADSEARNQNLLEWEMAPCALDAHPRAEHLLPLMVVAGAAEGAPGSRTFSQVVLGARLSGYRFG